MSRQVAPLYIAATPWFFTSVSLSSSITTEFNHTRFLSGVLMLLIDDVEAVGLSMTCSNEANLAS